jgi:hypothetical protein
MRRGSAERNRQRDAPPPGVGAAADMSLPVMAWTFRLALACGFALAFVAASAGDAPDAMALRAELLATIPDAWRQEDPPLPEDADAGPQLLLAAQAMRRIPAAEKVLAVAQLQALARFQSWPSGEGGTALASWLDEGGQQGALLLLAQALERSGLRRPGAPAAGDQLIRAMRADGDLLRLVALHAAERGPPAQVLSALHQLLRLCALARSSARSAAALMAAVSLEGQALRTIVAVCVRSPLRPEDLQPLRDSVLAIADGSLLPEVARAVLEDLLATLPDNLEDGAHWSEDLLALHQQGDVVRARLAENQGLAPPLAVDHQALRALSEVALALDRRATFATVLTWLIEVGEARPTSYQEWLFAMRGPTALRLRGEVGMAGRMLDLSAGAADAMGGAVHARSPAEEATQADADFARLLAAGPNPLGAIIADAHLQAGATLLRFLVERRTARLLCTTALDLLAAERRTGAWPADLGPAPPRDPFDGQPLRWNPVLGLLWSVGRDLADDGGDPRADIVMELRPPSP